MKSTRFWVAVIAFLLLMSFAAAAAVFLFYGAGNVVSVYHGGELIERIHLDTVTTPYTFTVESENNNYNVISVEQGRICVLEASCPDHVCIKTGWISDSVIPIVCLPNELVIQIDSGSNDGIDTAVQ